MSAEERRKHRQEQQRAQEHQRNQQIAASAAQEQIFGRGQGTDYLSESLKSKIDGGVRELLKSMGSRDFPLANYTQEQEHQIWWEIEILQDMVVWMHPREESALQGNARAFVYDDPDDTAMALTPREKLELIQAVKAYQSRVTRARDMKQQEINKTIRAESHRETEDSAGSSGGLLGRLRS